VSFVIRSTAGFYYHGLGGLGHRVFCDHRPEAQVFADRGDADRVKAEIDAMPDPNPNVCLLGLEVVPA
jgi:hypothetical protein